MSPEFLLPVNMIDYLDALLRVALGFFVWFVSGGVYLALAFSLLAVFFFFLRGR